MDDERRIALVDSLTVDNASVLTSPAQLIRYQLDNHLNSAGLELDDTAAVISYEEYYPFGTTSYRSGRSTFEVTLKRYRYVGKERDDETGLYYYGARYYAAWLARFVSVDPLKDDYPFYTPYQYAGNKPIAFIDLDGAEEFKPPLIERDATNINPARDKMLQVELFQRQQTQKQRDIQKLLSGKWADPRNAPNATFIGPDTDTRSFQERERQRRRFEAQQNFEQLKRDVSAISPFVGGGGDFGYGFASTTATAFKEAPFVVLPEIGIARFSRFVGSIDDAVRASRGLQNAKSSTLFGGDALSTGSRTASTFSEITVNAPRGILGASAGSGFKFGILNSDELARTALSGEGKTFTHFTSLEGIAGITGADESVLLALKPGEGFLVNELRFATGQNTFLAGEQGSICVTDLGINASEGALARIGIFKSTGKQSFAIQFTESEAFFSGAKTTLQKENIFTIPGGSTIQGVFKIIRTGN